jgi:hypothetical protein
MSQVPHEISDFSLSTMVESSKVQSERNDSSNASALEAPPVMPAELIKLGTCAFISEFFAPYREHAMRISTVSRWSPVRASPVSRLRSILTMRALSLM